MATMKLTNLSSRLDLFGPIFGKELRLAARRKRNYLLRSLYLLAMMGMMIYAWDEYVPGRFSLWGNPFLRNPVSGQIGLNLVSSLGYFQLFAFVLLAPMLTGYAIQEEIRRQTLQSLLATPITSLQIVTGKLFSRMLLIFLLAAASFPLMAVIRVFGGVDWWFILTIEALSLSAALFAGALGLYFSAICLKPLRDPALLTLLSLFLIYFAIPLAIMLSFGDGDVWFSVFDPAVSLESAFRHARNPSNHRYIGLSRPVVQCVLHLAGTFFLVCGTSRVVRRTEVKVNADLLKKKSKPGQHRSDFWDRLLQKRSSDDEIILISPESRWLDACSHRPVLWRELRNSIYVYPKKRVANIAIFLVLLSLAYLMFQVEFIHQGTQILFLEGFFVFILGRIAFLSAAAIAREKEAGTLELLFTTPLSGYEILRDKVLGLLPRILILSILLFFHVLLFSLADFIPYWTLLYVPLLLAGPLVFLIGLGIYISSRARDLRSSLISLFVLGVILWLPAFWNQSRVFSRPDSFWLDVNSPHASVDEAILSWPFDPFLYVPVCLTEHDNFTMGYPLPSFTSRLLIVMGGYMAVGFIFFLLAARRLSRLYKRRKGYL